MYMWAFTKAGMVSEGLAAAVVARLAPSLHQLPPASVAHLAAAYSGADSCSAFMQQLCSAAGQSMPPAF